METMIAGVHPSTPAALPLRDDGAFVFHYPSKFTWSRGEIPPACKWRDYSVYIHVPFCRRICTFCTFERKQLRRGAIDWFTDCLGLEMATLRERHEFSDARVKSVYLGGGTASLLGNDDIETLLRALREEFGLGDGVEVTLESEPGTKKSDDFRRLGAIGVNRVSIGIQAFQDDILRTLNRSHNAAQAVEMVRAAQDGGMENVHIDLMYALPGLTFAKWRESVDCALRLGVPHISIYQLIIFPDELLARMIHHGEAARPAEREEIHSMRLYADAAFRAAGYTRYSLSEYCKPGFECRYVQATWDGSDYLGMGPGAYSRNGHTLWEDDVIHARYEAKARAGIHPVGKSIVMTPRESMARDLALGLCLLTVDLDEIGLRAGADVVEEFGDTIEELAARNLVARDGNMLLLTETGIRYATHVMKAFVS